MRWNIGEKETSFSSWFKNWDFIMLQLQLQKILPKNWNELQLNCKLYQTLKKLIPKTNSDSSNGQIVADERYISKLLQPTSILSCTVTETICTWKIMKFIWNWQIISHSLLKSNFIGLLFIVFLLIESIWVGTFEIKEISFSS